MLKEFIARLETIFAVFGGTCRFANNFYNLVDTQFTHRHEMFDDSDRSSACVALVLAVES
jgi:hypothetical protein